RHFFIKKLADMKKLKRVYTQNIDNLKELAGLDVDWQFERSRLQYCDIFKKGETLNCPECQEKGQRSHLIGQLKPPIILYGDSHPKGLEIGPFAEQDQDKADCLIIIGTSLRILGVKALIKDFASAVHGVIV
ncbi:14081_t:CDS:2, partial [Racocetra fulgida]